MALASLASANSDVAILDLASLALANLDLANLALAHLDLVTYKVCKNKFVLTALISELTN